MSHLSQLPLDILNQIFSYYVRSDAVIKLWICGDSRLIKLLSNGAVTRISLYDTDCITKSRYPKFLAYLRRLKHLTIFRGRFSLGLCCDLAYELKKLSPTLEELHVNAENVEWALACPDTFCDLTWLFCPGSQHL